jgi:hypothetical protein
MRPSQFVIVSRDSWLNNRGRVQCLDVHLPLAAQAAARPRARTAPRRPCSNSTNRSRHDVKSGEPLV